MARVALALLLCWPLVVHADPVSLIASAVVSLGNFGGLMAVAIYAGAALLSTAQARRKQRKAQARQRAEYNASLQDRTVTVLSMEHPWQIVYGSPSPVGGALQAILTSGARDEYKHLLVVFAAHECDAIEEIYIEGEPVGPLDGSGWCTGGVFYEAQADASATEYITFDGAGIGTVSRTITTLLTVAVPVFGDERQTSEPVPATFSGSTVTAPAAAGKTVHVSYSHATGVGRVNVQKHLSPGGVDTADAFLMAAAPAYWTSAHRLSGFTYAIVTLDLNFGRFQGGPPNISARLRGKKLYDPRTGTTAYSANNALCAVDYLRSEYGYGATAGQVDTAAAIAAANACDAQGFTCHGTLSTGNDLDANLQQIEDSMAASTHFSGGVWRIMAGAWSTPVMTLTDAHLAARIEVVQASEPAERRYNGARGQYVPASDLGVAADITPYSVSAYVSADGVERVRDENFPLTATNAQCQKLAAIAVERSRLGLTIRYPGHFPAWPLQPGDRVYVVNAELGFASKPFRLVDWDYLSTAPIGLVLTEDAASAWTGTFSAVDPTRATSNLADPYAKPAAPDGLAVSSGSAQLIKASDGSIVTRVLVSWVASTVRAVLQGGYTQLQWRLAVEGAEWQSQDLPADSASQYLVGPPDGTTILVRVRYVTGVQALGAWATIAHQVIGKTEPPGDIVNLSIAGNVLSWDAVADIDLAGYVFRFHYRTNFDWGSAAPLHTGIIVASPFEMPLPPAGAVTIMGKAVDTSGNESRSVVAVVTDLGDPSIANVVESFDFGAMGFPGTLTGCTLSGGDLVAASTDSFFGTDNQSFYGLDTDPFYAASAYAQMVYITPEISVSNALAGSTGTLEIDAVGSDLRVEYRMAGAQPFYGPDADSFYGPDTDSFYGPPGPWLPWPGSLAMMRDVYQFRVTIGAGATQGVLSELALFVDAPDIIETLDDVSISSGGTTLVPTKPFTVIKNVQGTLQTNGSGAETIEITKTPPLSVVVKAFNSSHVAVSGATGDFTLKGY